MIKVQSLKNLKLYYLLYAFSILLELEEKNLVHKDGLDNIVLMMVIY